MKKYILTIFIVLFFSTSLFGTLNKSLPDLNYYNNLLLKLKSKNTNDPKELLQISLIYKIINLIKSNSYNYQLNLSDINNSNKLINKFLDFISIFANYLKSIDDYEEKEKKIDLLKSQLSTVDNSSKDYLILKLQYDFYLINLNILNKKIDYIEKNYKQWLTIFAKKIDTINFKPSNKKLEDLQKEINNNLLKIEKLKIEKERLELLNKKELVKNIEESISYYKKKNEALAKDIIKIYLNHYFYELKNKNKKVFIFKNKIKEVLNKYFSETYYINSFNIILEKLIKIKFGTKSVFIHDTKNTIKNTITYIFYLLRKPIFTINKKGISCIDIILALFVFIIGIFLGTLYKKYIKKLTYKGINLTQSTQTLISNIGYYLIIIIAFFATLKVLGIDLTSLTIIVGALSVGIGFGLQSIISNFMCGLIMMFEKSIKIGDIIELDPNLVGKVVSINMRATIINTYDNIDVIIPNQTLFTSNVINWTMSDDIRRLRIPFGVAYGTDIDKVESAILSELYESDLDFIRKDENRKPKIVMIEMSDSSVNFELFVWVHVVENKGKKILISEFLKLIYKALYKHNIEIPFPQMDIHVKDIKDKLVIKKEDNNNG